MSSITNTLHELAALADGAARCPDHAFRGNGWNLEMSPDSLDAEWWLRRGRAFGATWLQSADDGCGGTVDGWAWTACDGVRDGGGCVRMAIGFCADRDGAMAAVEAVVCVPTDNNGPAPPSGA
jgi:hypothetical protein